jgi:hypothetical protein
LPRAARPQPLSGRLRICAAVTFARLRVIPSLPIFLAEHPALDVDVVLRDGDIDLIDVGIDVALRMSPLRDSALTGRKIGRRPMRVVGTPLIWRQRACRKLPRTFPRIRRSSTSSASEAPHGPFGREPRKSPSPSAAGSMSLRRKVFGRGACQPGLCHRIRVDVRARAEIRRGRICAGRLVAAGCRSLGGVPDRTTGQSQVPRLCGLYRAADCRLRSSVAESKHGDTIANPLAPLERQFD